NAANAANAQNAVNAENATNAENAETAASATNATNAVNAQNAVNAENAANATNAENAANAAALGGQAPAAFAAASHNHDARYYTKAQSDDRFVQLNGVNKLIANSADYAVLSIEQEGTFDGVFAISAAEAAGRGALHGRAGATGPLINSAAGVLGSSATLRGVIGTSGSNDGVLGWSTSQNGVYGQSIDGTGVRAFSQNGTALVVLGNATVSGSFSVSGAKSFRIDHPLDPKNMYLYHAAIESPDMMNIYNGNVTLDADGEAWVLLPDYFEALNRDFRYQLTPIGGAGPNLFVAQEVAENRFKISGGTPGLSVSWQVSGIRHDPYAEANPLEAEVEKPAAERGTYLNPEVYGQNRVNSADSIIDSPAPGTPGVQQAE
ncbi:MAG: hypothetical protein WDZ49_17510, partial [Litorilinea sp.]